MPDKLKVFETGSSALRFGTTDDHVLFLIQDQITGTLHVYEDNESMFSNHLCGSKAAPSINTSFVVPIDVMPSLRPNPDEYTRGKNTGDFFGLPRGMPTTNQVEAARAELKQFLCGNCWRRLTGKKWEGSPLEMMIIHLFLKYYDIHRPSGTDLVIKGTKRIIEKEIDMLETTSVITVILKVEFDLSDTCPTEITDAIQEIREKACEYGAVDEMTLTTDGPLNVDLSTL